MLISPAQLSPRQEEILTASRKLFRERGFEGASMRDLAEVLQIKPASLYSHYRSKEDILWEIAQRCADEFFEEVMPHTGLAESAPQRLGRMVEAHLRVVIRNQDASAIFFREWEHLAEPRRRAFAARIRAYEGAFAQVIADGMAKGDFQPRPAHLAADALLASLNWIHRWYKSGGALSHEEITAHLTEMAIASLRPIPSTHA